MLELYYVLIFRYNRKIKGMCSISENDFSFDEINGECPSCGEDTVNGVAYDQCLYSELSCKTCGAQPCEGRC